METETNSAKKKEKIEKAGKNEQIETNEKDLDNGLIPEKESALQMMKAMQDLPDEMILDAVWEEDMAAPEKKEGTKRKKNAPWMVIGASVAAAAIIGLSARGLAGHFSRPEKESGVEEVITEQIESKNPSPNSDPGLNGEKDSSFSELTGTETKVTEASTGVGNGNSPALKHETSTEAISGEKTGRDSAAKEKGGKAGNAEASDKKDVTEVHYDEDTNKNKDKIDEKKSDDPMNPQDELSTVSELESQIEAQKAYKILIDHFDPEGSGIYPDTFGGACVDDGCVYFAVTSREACRTCLDLLKGFKCGITWRSVERSYMELKADYERILGSNDGKIQSAEIDVKGNRVRVFVRDNDLADVGKQLRDLDVEIVTESGRRVETAELDKRSDTEILLEYLDPAGEKNFPIPNGGDEATFYVDLNTNYAYPDSFGGIFYGRDPHQPLTILVTSEQARETYKKMLKGKRWKKAVYRIVNYSVRELTDEGKRILSDYGNQFMFLQVGVDLEKNDVFVKVNEHDKDRITELVKDLPIKVRVKTWSVLSPDCGAPNLNWKMPDGSDWPEWAEQIYQNSKLMPGQ